MATVGGPRIVRSGLVLNLDAAQRTSYLGSGTAWNDLSGNRNNATLINGPTFSSANGGLINFDGIDDYGNLGNILTYTTGNFSFCMWFNFNDLADGDNALFNKGTNYAYSVDSSGNFLYNYSYSGGSSSVQLPASIATNKWYFLASSRNGLSHTFRIYRPSLSVYVYTLNNQQNPSSNSDSFLFATNGFDYANIKIASLSNYNRNLSASEILQNYNTTKGRFGL